MTDYNIKKVHKNDDGVIEKVMTDKGEMSVLKVIRKMTEGDQFHVPSGEGVHPLGKDHIRSNPNRSEGDNLDHLPQY